MTKQFFLIILFFISLSSYSQIVISNDDSIGDSSSILDVKSTTQGLLLPRLTTVQREAIQNPANGLMIYNTDSKILEIFGGNTWTDLNGKETSRVICGVSSVDFGGITYHTVMYNGRCWLDRNLGATQVATAANDSLGFGYYYQWGRLGDGHQHPANDTTSAIAVTSVPGHSLFILSPSTPYDWQDPQNVNLWNPGDYTNNPCPNGWKVPELAEWKEAFAGWNNSSDAYNSALKLPAAGYRSHTDGSIIPNTGGYWSASLNGKGSEIVYFDNTAIGNLNKYRARGFSVRCIESADDVPFKLYSKAYGGAATERAQSLNQTSDGGFVIAGITESYGEGAGDFLLLKSDTTGNLDFGKAYGTSGNEECFALKVTTDNGYILTGNSGSDLYNVKSDSMGNVDWEQTLSYGGTETNRDVVQDTDGGFVFIGYTNGTGAGGNDHLITKRDASGNNVWAWTIGGTGNEYGYGIIKDVNGGFAFCGASNSSGAGAYDFQFQKLDAGGNSQWGWYMGGTENEYARALTQTYDSGYVLVGYTYSFGAGAADVYVRKVNSDGTTGWGSVMGGTEDDYAFSVALTDDHGFIIAGQTKSFGAGLSDVWLVKLDADGNFMWSWVIGGPDHESGSSVVVGDDGCYYVAGYTRSYGVGGGTDDALLVKFTPDGSTCLGYYVGLPAVAANMSMPEGDIFEATPVSKLFFQKVSGNEKAVRFKSKQIKNPSNAGRSTSTTTTIIPTVTTICGDE